MYSVIKKNCRSTYKVQGAYCLNVENDQVRKKEMKPLFYRRYDMHKKVLLFFELNTNENIFTKLQLNQHSTWARKINMIIGRFMFDR